MLTANADAWGWYESCQTETLYIPEGVDAVFNEDPPSVLIPGGYLVGWGNGDFGKSSWGTVCQLEWSNGPVQQYPEMSTQYGGGGGGGTIITPPAPLKVSDCNYELYRDAGGRWIRDSLMTCSRPRTDKEFAELDSSAILMLPDTSSVRQPNDSARAECAAIIGWTRQALNDIRSSGNIGIWVGKGNTYSHGGQSHIGSGVGHIDPRKFDQVEMFRKIWVATPNSSTRESYMTARRDLLRTLAHEATHAYGGLQHVGGIEEPNYTQPYWNRLNTQGENQCIQ
jgi:hypothetical protein